MPRENEVDRLITQARAEAEKLIIAAKKARREAGLAIEARYQKVTAEARRRFEAVDRPARLEKKAALDAADREKLEAIMRAGELERAALREVEALMAKERDAGVTGEQRAAPEPEPELKPKRGRPKK